MPCIILTGHPNSGKTSIAKRIREIALKNHGEAISHSVVIVNDDLVCPGIPLQESYGTSLAEKKTRGAIKAAFDRAVASNPTSLVILDSLNYIKGFRYELFCISKAASQKHCVLWVMNDESNIMPSGRYGKDLYDALKMRYEPPDERNRWDNPLYRIDLSQQGQAKQAAGQILNQSVYNMHNLSRALGTATAADKSTIDDNDPKPTAKPKSAASTFKKRATFKRPPNTSQVTSSSAVPTSLTAEALSAFNNKASEETARPWQNQELSRQDKAVAKPSISNTEAVPLSLDSQIETILRSFLQDVQPLRQGTSTKQNVAADANVLNRFDAVSRRIAAGNPDLTTIQRQYMSWISTRPPNDVSQEGIETSFRAFIDLRKT